MMRIWIDVGGRVDWHLDAAPISAPTDLYTIGASPLRLTIAGDSRQWNPSDLLAARVGQCLKGVRPGKVWLRVYIGDMSPLWFWSFVESNSRKWFLYWNDVDSD